MAGSQLRVLERGRLPPRLADLPEPPTRLYLHGELPGGPAAAIVGTRYPSDDGEQYARHLAGVLAAEGVAILSGGASGIDTAAHRGALDVGGFTLVVAPSGFDRPYPEDNAELYAEIVARGGGFLSAVPPQVPATNDRFFLRNRLTGRARPRSDRSGGAFPERRPQRRQARPRPRPAAVRRAPRPVELPGAAAV